MLPECIIIILTITKEKQIERLLSRYEGKASEGIMKSLTDMHEWFGPPEQDEENTFEIEVTDKMSPADTMRKVFKILSKLSTGNQSNDEQLYV